MPSTRPSWSSDVVGREVELDGLDLFLTGEDVANVLLLIGSGGIGKTVLFDAAVRRADELGYALLVARPTVAEANYAFSAVSDLVNTVPDSVFEALPSPQRQAISVAMLHAPAPKGGVDERALGVGLRSIIEAMCAQGPTLVGVDDAQWLDPSSLRMLTYALRRVSDASFRCLATIRPGTTSDPSEMFGSALAPSQRRVFEVGPLGLTDLQTIIERQCGSTLSRPLLARVDRICAGNPLHAREIARVLLAQDDHGSPREVPLPESVSDVFTQRLRHLPESTRRALLDTSLLAQPTTQIIDRDDLAAAEVVGLVTFDAERIRFAHPLIATAVYQLASIEERRQRHGLLADHVVDPEESARHRALACRGPVAEVAAQLDTAARHAAARGATEAACELADLAVALTPTSDVEDLANRRIAAARQWIATGDLDHASAIIDHVIDSAPEPRTQAFALQLRGQIHIRRADLPAAIAAATDALAAIDDRGEPAAALHLDLAFCSTNLGDLGGAVAHADAAVAAAECDPDQVWLADALSTKAMTGFLVGNGIDSGCLDRADLAARSSTKPADTVMSRPQLVRALLELWSGDLECARVALSAVHADLVARGEESSIPLLSLYRVWAALWAGDFAEAGRLADESAGIATLLGDDLADGFARSAGALVHAHRGRRALAVQEADIAAARFASLQFALGTIWPCWAMGIAALGDGDLDVVDAALGELARMVTASPVDPVLGMFLPEEIEALAGLGRFDEAQPLLGWLIEAAQRLDRTWARAAATRSRAVVLASTGDLDAANLAIDEALELHATLDFPFERARTLLAAGRILRRRTRRGEAHAVLTEARDLFGRLGATSFEASAARELDRLGRRAAAPLDLTETERLVAELAAQGLSNREIADRAFLSVKAVEANLTRVYRKLGIRSRAGIVWHLTDRPDDDRAT